MTIANWKERVLVIAPHADDETLGCGGLLATLDDSERRVLFMSIGKSPPTSTEQTDAEMQGAMQVLGVTDTAVMKRGAQGRLDQLATADIVSWLDKQLAAFQPTAVLLPYASHHQDHEVTYRAALAALRPRASTTRIALVALYEYPYVAAWPPPELPGGKFHFALSAEALDRKLRALACYRSQVEREDAWLTVTRAGNWATNRGAEVGVPAAEAFWAIRGWL